MTFLPSADWLRSDRHVPLGAGEVQVWQVDIAAPWLVEAACEALLSLDETDRLRRMRHGTARNEFRVGRACLRTLLGAALGRDPRDIAFTTGDHGKPAVEGMQFNVAHSRGLVLIALCRDAAVGIDLEWIDERIEALDIAEGGLATEEIAAVAAAHPGLMRALTFYRCWTRKEAVVKAHGRGLTQPLTGFAVSVEGCAEKEVRMGPDGAGQAENFHVRELKLGGSFIGAVALGKPGYAVQQFLLTGFSAMNSHVGGKSPGAPESDHVCALQNQQHAQVTSSKVTLPPCPPNSSAMGNANRGL